MIRLARPSDAAALAAIYGPVVRDTSISFELEPPDAAEMAARLARTLPTHPWLVWEDDGAVVGYAYAGPHNERAAYRWAVNVSVYLAEAARGRGVGRALYEALHTLLAAQGFVMANAGITLPNPASVGLHEALGYTPVALYRSVGFKKGTWYDVGWWQRPLRPRPETPAEPVALDALPPEALENALRPARSFTDSGKRTA